MAVRFSTVVVVFVVAAVLVAGARAQTQDCTQYYTYLTSCLSFVGGNDTTPSLACCSGINNLNTNNLDCLCQITEQYNNGTTPGVNVTRIYELPSKCGITVDTVKCPALALPPGVAIAPTPPFLSPPTTSPGGTTTGPSSSPAKSPAAASIPAPHLAVTTLGIIHLLWHALSAT